MKISTNDQGIIVVTEVFTPIILRTRRGEEIYLSMRDSGFELTYGGARFTVQGGTIKTKDDIKVVSRPDTIPFDRVVSTFVTRTFGFGYPITPLNTWHDSHMALFWKYISKEVLPYYNGITDVPSEYLIIYGSLWLEEVEKRKTDIYEF